MKKNFITFKGVVTHYLKPLGEAVCIGAYGSGDEINEILANVKHFFTYLGNQNLTWCGKQYFTWYGNEFFTLVGKQFFTSPVSKSLHGR